MPACPRVRIVDSFAALAETPFAHGVNALCWPRTLRGDFREVAEALPVKPGINSLDEAELARLRLSPSGREAVASMLADLQMLRARDLSPELNCIAGCERGEDPAPVRTDVHSFHVDSATVPADTWLCTYLGDPSEGLDNDEALPRVDVPETRAALLRLHGGTDDDAFREFLNENFYDLHYAPLPGAKPYSFGVGNLWRIATEHPGSLVPPCIHRAPLTLPGMPRRLLLIS
jgi:hypothetical protein